MDQNKIRKARTVIYTLSAIIPIVIAVLFEVKIEGLDFSFLPPIYASINGLTALLLIGALVAIKSKNRRIHENLIKLSLVLSFLFLLAYVAYHMTSDPTLYLGAYASLYYTLLISHIFLSILVIPLVLFTYLHAWTGNYQKHKRWARFAWPIWFYVAGSGVVVYLMISPFYA